MKKTLEFRIAPSSAAFRYVGCDGGSRTSDLRNNTEDFVLGKVCSNHVRREREFMGFLPHLQIPEVFHAFPPRTSTNSRKQTWMLSRLEKLPGWNCRSPGVRG